MRTVRPKLGVFSKYLKDSFLLLYYSAYKRATEVVFIWGDRGYPVVRFEYKTASERYLVAKLWAKQFGVFFEKNLHSEFSRKHPKLFCIYLSNKISLRGRFVFKTNDRISSITSFKGTLSLRWNFWYMKDITLLNTIDKVKNSISTPFTFKLTD